MQWKASMNVKCLLWKLKVLHGKIDSNKQKTFCHLGIIRCICHFLSKLNYLHFLILWQFLYIMCFFYIQMQTCIRNKHRNAFTYVSKNLMFIYPACANKMFYETQQWKQRQTHLYVPDIETHRDLISVCRAVDLQNL